VSSPNVSLHLSIELLPATKATDQRLVDEITKLTNQVYATAEEGMWVDGATRTTPGEVGEMIAAGQIAVARTDGQVVGSIRVQRLDDGVGEFAMLVAHPARRGEGVGRELVSFAEELSRQRGLATMQLELLVPRGWSHPTKEFLHAWYTRIGYRPVRTGSMEDSYPQLAPYWRPRATSSCTTSPSRTRLLLVVRRSSSELSQCGWDGGRGWGLGGDGWTAG
jgi:GNAT superfamily N-acetyltransferase